VLLADMADPSVDLPASFRRHLRRDKSARRRDLLPGGRPAARRFPTGRGVDMAVASREDIHGVLRRAAGPLKPATAANRHRALRVFYPWLEDEG
jgi:hypothetical protein